MSLLLSSYRVGDNFSSGASCSKLTMSLVNDSLKFQMAILQIQCYFLLIKQQKITVYLLL